MLPEPRGRQAVARRRAVDADPQPHLGNAPVVRAVGIEEPALEELGVGADLVDAIDRARGYFRFDEDLQPFVARPRPKHFLYFRDDPGARGAAIDVGRMARVA